MENSTRLSKHEIKDISGEAMQFFRGGKVYANLYSATLLANYPQMHQIEKLDANVLPNPRSQIRQVFTELREIDLSLIFRSAHLSLTPSLCVVGRNQSLHAKFGPLYYKNDIIVNVKTIKQNFNHLCRKLFCEKPETKRFWRS